MPCRQEDQSLGRVTLSNKIHEHSDVSKENINSRIATRDKAVPLSCASSISSDIKTDARTDGKSRELRMSATRNANHEGIIAVK